MFGNVIDKKVQAEVGAHFAEATKPHAAVKDVYKAARPILVFASTFFVLPQNWQQVLQALVFGLDNLLLQAPQAAAH